MLANVMLAGEVCQKLSGPADGNICSVFLILLIDRMLKHRNTGAPQKTENKAR